MSLNHFESPKYKKRFCSKSLLKLSSDLIPYNYSYKNRHNLCRTMPHCQCGINKVAKYRFRVIYLLFRKNIGKIGADLMKFNK